MDSCHEASCTMDSCTMASCTTATCSTGHLHNQTSVRRIVEKWIFTHLGTHKSGHFYNRHLNNRTIVQKSSMIVSRPKFHTYQFEYSLQVQQSFLQFSIVQMSKCTNGHKYLVVQVSVFQLSSCSNVDSLTIWCLCALFPILLQFYVPFCVKRKKWII